jgi:hypothetical protein
MILCALIVDLRKTFTFDAIHHIVRWKGRTVLKAELVAKSPSTTAPASARNLRAPGRETSPPDHHPASHNPHGCCDGAVNATTTADLSTPLRSR